MKAAVVQKPNTSVVIAERPIRHLQEEAYELGAEYIC